MKNLLAVLLLIVSGLSGFGIYRGWFVVDQQRIALDEASAKAEMHDIEQKVKDTTADLKSPAKGQN